MTSIIVPYISIPEKSFYKIKNIITKLSNEKINAISSKTKPLSNSEQIFQEFSWDIFLTPTNENENAIIFSFQKK